MSNMQTLITELEKIIAEESSASLTMLGSYVLGTILRDYNDLYESNFTVASISDYASDLEAGSGDEEYMAEAWENIKRLTQKLRDQQG